MVYDMSVEEIEKKTLVLVRNETRRACEPKSLSDLGLEVVG